jgi:hypothetical protein
MSTMHTIIATRSIPCPTCNGAHEVKHAHWFDERGRKVSEAEAVLCAHFMAEYDHKARTTEFRLFEPRAGAGEAARGAGEGVRAGVPEGCFAATWERPRAKRRVNSKR